MTEAEWLASTDPTPMLDFLRGKASERKLRVLSGQLCLSYFAAYSWPDQADSTKAIAEESIELGCLPDWKVDPPSDALPCILLHEDPSIAVVGVVKALGEWIRKGVLHHYLFRGDFDDAVGNERRNHNFDRCFEEIETNSAAFARVQSKLIRDIFGNPFCPVSVDPAWLTSTVVALAEGIYAEKAFDRMPILADALMDAGCAEAEVLNHCRADGPHVRGCWVVDSLTGKG